MSTKTWHKTPESSIEACYLQLMADGLIEPLSRDEEESKQWNLRELASLVEGHFHEQLDISRLPDDERLAQESRVTYHGGPMASPHSHYCHPFWLLADGQRVGTIALGTIIYGLDLISVSSLYVDPAHRRRNIARRTLEAVFQAAVANDAGGIRLDTHWTWEPSVRFYARIGMWVWMWKHNLVLAWHKELPEYRVEIGESEARFLIQQNGQWRVVITARNLGDRLGWEEASDLRDLPLETSHCIPGTFALHLALAGWPLIRSEESWERRHDWSDAGEPEGLAYKIEIFEAVERQRGFVVRTPRIPSLQYRDLDDID